LFLPLDAQINFKQPWIHNQISLYTRVFEIQFGVNWRTRGKDSTTTGEGDNRESIGGRGLERKRGEGEEAAAFWFMFVDDPFAIAATLLVVLILWSHGPRGPFACLRILRPST